MMNTRVKVSLSTAIPIVLVSIVSLFSKEPDLNKGLGIAWLVAGSIWILALITALGLYIKNRKEIALGMIAGAALGFASLVITMILFIVLHQTGVK
ncbi:MAG: hypothetical protein JSU79_00150 [Dehalococcoidales bacterium]|nr:MAG: hypothetical protein JSU79_00150 [Dehalococcoidales bacterium]